MANPSFSDREPPAFIVDDLVPGFEGTKISALPMTIQPLDDARDAELQLQVMLTMGESIKGDGRKGMIGNYFVRAVRLRVGDFSATPSAAQTVDGIAAYTWGPTAQMVADVQSWLDQPSDNFGWMLLGNEAASQTAKRFDSRENATPGFRPKLTVYY